MTASKAARRPLGGDVKSSGSGSDAQAVPAEQGDGDIERLVREGDAAAFGLLFDRHAGYLHAYCARRAEDHDADDLLSVTFFEAWRHRDRALLVDGSFRPWLVGIARNTARTASRSRRRYRAALARYEGLRHDTEDDLAELAIRTVDGPGTARNVAAAMSRLAPRDRDVAELCLLDGMTVSAAAVVLGVPAGTVKSRLSRARAKLARLLQPGELVNHPALAGHGRGERPPAATAGRA
jgi:RNA polymerase sigma factor (sigma-70 family)